ncbi:MAG: SgcJ/EcaC family oxidoreductase [Planctomycetota bacterium]
MTDDEQAVRRWHDDWIRATTEGDLDLSRGLIADGAVFLMPGAPPMDGETFAVAMTGSDPDHPPDPNVAYELDAKVNEVRVFADHAVMWSEFALTTTKKDTGETSRVAGHALTFLERSRDGWKLVRDANTMAPA